MLEGGGGWVGHDTTQHSTNISEGFVYFNMILFEFGSGDWYELKCLFPFRSMTDSPMLQFDTSE